jgi:predicted Zn-dependent protease
VTRAAVIAVAVVVLGWLGVMERAERLQRDGASEGDYRAARLLNPGTLPDVRRAFLYQGTGRPGQAAELLRDVLRREPDNLDVWGLLYTFTRERDPASAQQALAARARLDPLGAR